ncbi:SURF1 family cytochrome oxidase biogenesis protein [Cryobacterium sp. 10S3]|uniref:SURF1 family cytochrome oxidase biogenesis protein n=2 Tax=Cryobacterium TaxID=69578 RepID=UPI002AC939D9|nr:SURF1 family cytochrome oxidase biogenesis protein [Cryobacterium sp. 10S3]MEB0285688.1 SURF1 family cytochrome oxidase biogenesis protein [Cryobacterium sp. 10S3]WPX12818.1 SURF1 family cytochrome oxidase biogenesis protein [Cryobacterium sp. 10S3]
MIRMMLRPRWILALLLALAVAAGFAALGRWQLERAVASGVVVEKTTETVKPLADVVTPGGAPRDAATGQLVTVDGSYVPGDEQLISDRSNDGASGYWVVSHFIVGAAGSGSSAGASIAVARGWAPDEATARSTMEGLASAPANQVVTLAGRFLPTEAPVVPADGRDPHGMTTVSTAALINLWAGFDGTAVYPGYIVDGTAASGLTGIDSPAPLTDASLNWLNIFYAIEWVVFAGFAVFLWYRLVRDAWEREEELREEAAISAG